MRKRREEERRGRVRKRREEERGREGGAHAQQMHKAEHTRAHMCAQRSRQKKRETDNDIGVCGARLRGEINDRRSCEALLNKCRVLHVCGDCDKVAARISERSATVLRANCWHACRHRCMHTYTHMHTHAHTCTHTHIWSVACACTTLRKKRT